MRPLGLASLVLAASLVACGGDDDAADAGATGTAAFRVARYDVELDLATLATRTTLTVAIEQGGDCLRLPMRADFVAATLDGAAPSSAAVADDVLTVCGPSWPPGAEVALAVDATLTANPAGGEELGYALKQDGEGAPYHQLIAWVGGCDRMAPCDNAPDRFARYRFTVHHAEGVRLLCPGTLAPGETTSECTFDFDGGPTYSTFGLVAGPSWTESALGTTDGVDLVLYDMPSAGFAADLSTAKVTGFLSWMIARFGAYPYGDELRLIAAPTYWNGFEHPGNVTLNHRLNEVSFPASPYADPLHHTTFHEIAHQWAGDETTLAGTYDFVWKEAMAEYLSFVYEDEAIGATTSARTAAYWKLAATGAAYFPVPGEAPALVDYYGDVYGAGPMVLFRQLEAMFGRAAVLEALASVLGSPRALSVGELLAALEASTGADLDGYADAWIYGEGAPAWPVFDVTTTPRTGGLTVTVTQQAAADGLFGCAFAVALHGAAEEDVALAEFDLGVDGAATASVDVDLAFAVEEIVFDPHATCLATMAPAPGVRPARPPRVNPFVAGR
jgi:aminopeptidase N